MGTLRDIPGGMAPVIEMAHAVASYQAVMETLRALDDDAAAGPSLLPRWTRAHVVAHLARHADGHRRMLEGVLRGEVVQQYPGGAEGRAHEIQLAAAQRAQGLVDDLRRSSEALFGVWERLSDDLWDQPTAMLGGTRPARATVWARWRELEVHHVDLALAFRAEQWPRAFLQMALPRVVGGLPERRRDGDSPAAWLVHATDGMGAWLIADDGATAAVSDAADAADGGTAPVRVAGPAWALLFWMLGRGGLDGLPVTVEGEAALAASLPGRFPYP